MEANLRFKLMGGHEHPDDSVHWQQHVQNVLSAAGRGHGGARDRVVGLLAGERCAMSVVEIEEAFRDCGHRIGRASIYRVLDLLLEHGLVERVEVGDGQARFERTQPGGEHHHHLVCQRCGQLIAFDDPGLERAIERLSTRLGARVQSHEVLLRGECGRCV